jgi:hypothetical protein
LNKQKKAGRSFIIFVKVGNKSFAQKIPQKWGNEFFRFPKKLKVAEYDQQPFFIANLE